MLETSTTQADPGYTAVNRFIGENVKVYVMSGAILCGRLERCDGKFVYVSNACSNREAVVNLDHVASITRQDYRS